MPAPTSARDKGRTAKQGRSDEEFVLFLQGIPAHCRWQELKDLVRQTALHIRQAIVYDDQHGFPTGLGQIIVKNEDEAWRTYQRLSTNGWEGQSLVVTLARTSSPTRPVAGPTKSPTCVIPATYVAGYSTPPRVTQNMAIPPSPISPEPIIASSPAYQNLEYGPVIDLMSIPHQHQPYLPMFTDSITQHAISTIPQSSAPLRHAFGDALTMPILPNYPLPAVQPFLDSPMSTRFGPTGRRNLFPRKSVYNYRYPDNPSFSAQAYNHQPSNAADANPRSSPRRTVFVQNLSPATSTLALRDFLQNSGVTVEYCEVPLDRETGRCKGYARVRLQSAEEAKRTIALYSGCTFLGARIRVKMDRGVVPHMAPNLPAGLAAHLITETQTTPANPTLTPATSIISNCHVPRPQNENDLTIPAIIPRDHCRPGAEGEGGGSGRVSCNEEAPTAATTPTPREVFPPSSPSSSSTSTAAKQAADRCHGPLVVNGSGTGRNGLAT
ncbi:uncharacterized protein BP01DRAFT_378618 [Aspergillus saccharolyticus JOP 1030-1]|uniref:RRM domain-containing protein n=1 Tax=Aspergillus saccharolyticus JOP 1030-1 TaxID=1450539 RepID=A0A318ZQV7_9EURO|nr:hypothetical protein BP01DRAFT_378618 [Aspergillus saccharolyticus JOP 1030-1]PYH50009.1 hypothetical protein BP01DRAFT_378618 [Aspergillus saccharolyticus JOP 1030-1]